MTDNAIVVSTSRFLSPAATIQEALARYAIVGEFASRVLKADHDYGVIPGTGKPTLLKPGAEKLSSLFGLSPAFAIAEKDLDWTGEKHGGEPFFYFQYLCTMYAGERIIAQGVGSCNSWEKKYRYRNSDRLCPKCGKATIIKGREEYGGGWLCFAKKGGCGAKFGDTDQTIVGQQTGQVKNPDPADIVNTIDKMAQKRALIAATLIATNASEYFTQDLEDFSQGTFTEFQPVVTVVQPSQPEPVAVADVTSDAPVEADPGSWPPELIAHLIGCNLGVKDPVKCEAMLMRSKIATQSLARRNLELWVSWYCQGRKASRSEAEAADDADSKLANVLAAAK